jgi:hypothetical protein
VKCHFADKGKALVFERGQLRGEEGPFLGTTFGADFGFNVAQGFAFGDLIEDRFACLLIGPEIKLPCALANKFLPRVPRHFKVTVIDVQITISVQRLDRHRNGAGLEGLGEPLLEIDQLRLRLLGEKPLLRQCMGHLEHFDIIEWLFEDEYTI